MKFFFSIGVNLYYTAVLIASIWNPKARKWIKGRKESKERLTSFEIKENVYWFHCASLGEFEQGRPLIEALKAEQQCQIVVTFFSPSGYEIRKNYDLADLVIYLPKDSLKNARLLLDRIKPSAVFFIKYEFWANYILETKNRNIPIYLVSGLFREKQIFFKRYGGYMRSVLKAFTKIFVQNEESRELLKSINVESEVSGDTRYDRVMKNAENVEDYPEVRKFCGDSKVFICGSIWSEDLEIIKKKLNDISDWKVIIAPHEISEKFIRQIEGSLSRSFIRYSNIKDYTNEEVLIIDNVGMLMNLYQYGDAAFIGGGYRTGLHNILEPAAFGLPVFFGNKFEKFPEAFTFLENTIGYTIPDSSTFYHVFDGVTRQELKTKVLDFMNAQKGATEKVLNVLQNS